MARSPSSKPVSGSHMPPSVVISAIGGPEQIVAMKNEAVEEAYVTSMKAIATQGYANCEAAHLVRNLTEYGAMIDRSREFVRRMIEGDITCQSAEIINFTLDLGLPYGRCIEQLEQNYLSIASRPIILAAKEYRAQKGEAFPADSSVEQWNPVMSILGPQIGFIPPQIASDQSQFLNWVDGHSGRFLGNPKYPWFPKDMKAARSLIVLVGDVYEAISYFPFQANRLANLLHQRTQRPDQTMQGISQNDRETFLKSWRLLNGFCHGVASVNRGELPDNSYLDEIAKRTNLLPGLPLPSSGLTLMEMFDQSFGLKPADYFTDYQWPWRMLTRSPKLTEQYRKLFMDQPLLGLS